MSSRRHSYTHRIMTCPDLSTFRRLAELRPARIIGAEEEEEDLEQDREGAEAAQAA